MEFPANIASAEDFSGGWFFGRHGLRSGVTLVGDRLITAAQMFLNKEPVAGDILGCSRCDSIDSIIGQDAGFGRWTGLVEGEGEKRGVELGHAEDEGGLVGVANQAAVIDIIPGFEPPGFDRIEAQARIASGKAVEASVVVLDDSQIMVDRDPGDGGAHDIERSEQRDRKGDVELFMAERNDQAEQAKPGAVVVGFPAGCFIMSDF